jgi:hypothetical protein
VKGGRPRSASPIDLSPRQFAAAHVDLQLAGVLGEPPCAQGRQADRAAPCAVIAPAGYMLVPQAGSRVVDNRLTAAFLTSDRQL